ncbi:MAG: aminotransferase class III-fold pyridoxal phosphate-dependent enzyme [Chloroflexi bacterium]|nr:aminotransferase class III-fold pyridoxal phosphate-dependent enzyme [Chloroflexota bacterium]
MTTIVQSVTELENQHTSGGYSKRPLTIVRGEGSTLYDDAGNAYLDATSGMGVALLGHGHPAVAAAIAQQASTLITLPEIFYNDKRAEFYSVLSEILPGDLHRYFLCNSGTEAIEGALKVARLLTGRTGIVAAKRGFHGRTLGSLGLTWNQHYREPFVGWTPENVTHIVYNDLASADAAITDQTAAVVIEAIQGESGVYPATAEFLQGLRKLCDERGALLIMDEIQTGLGRTGKWFGFQHSDILPDVVAMGKGIAGGVPMGAVAWRESLGQIEQGTHSSTFGGNPLAAAAGVAALTALREIDAPARSAELGSWLLGELRERDLPFTREVRGAGLMVGIELKGRVTPVIQGLQERGVLALVAGKTVLRLLPPLIITPEELRRLADAVEETLTHVTD